MSKKPNQRQVSKPPSNYPEGDGLDYTSEYGSVGVMYVKKNIAEQADSLYDIVSFDPHDTPSKSVAKRVKVVISALNEMVGDFVSPNEKGRRAE